MDCTACGVSNAGSVKVEYIDEMTEQVNLCSGCQSKFEDGNLVTEVSAVDRYPA